MCAIERFAPSHGWGSFDFVPLLSLLLNAPIDEGFLLVLGIYIWCYCRTAMKYAYMSLYLIVGRASIQGTPTSDTHRP